MTIVLHKYNVVVYRPSLKQKVKTTPSKVLKVLCKEVGHPPNNEDTLIAYMSKPCCILAAIKKKKFETIF
jgi:hypothetical protein